MITQQDQGCTHDTHTGGGGGAVHTIRTQGGGGGRRCTHDTHTGGGGGAVHTIRTQDKGVHNMLVTKNYATINDSPIITQ